MITQKRRLTAIDKTRAFAILCMITIHFGPGVFDRLPSLDFLMEPVLFLGRFATTAFIIVFGITIGYIYIDKYIAAPGPVSKKIYARARLLFIYAIIICIPNYINLVIQGDTNPSHWLYGTYSILNYYAIALFTLPLWLRFLTQNLVRNSLLLGASFWILGYLLLQFWHFDDALVFRRYEELDLYLPENPDHLGFLEYLRLTFISGPYAYLQLSGSAILAILAGYFLRKLNNAGRITEISYYLIPISLVLTVSGIVLGIYFQEFSIHNVVVGDIKAPPRLWYWLFFSGPTLLVLLLFVIIDLRPKSLAERATYPLAIFGQGSLIIYTGHSFVLPMINWLDVIYPTEGLLRILIPFLLFFAFCGLVMMYYHRQNQAILTATS